MPNDCDKSKCHEEMVLELSRRVTWPEHNILKDMVNLLKDSAIPKSWLWKVACAFGIPVFVFFVVIWGNQKEFASKDSCNINAKEVSGLKLNYVFIERNQIEIKNELADIAKMMRRQWGKGSHEGDK